VMFHLLQLLLYFCFLLQKQYMFIIELMEKMQTYKRKKNQTELSLPRVNLFLYILRSNTVTIWGNCFFVFLFLNNVF
jgi:hypothetical protein